MKAPAGAMAATMEGSATPCPLQQGLAEFSRIVLGNEKHTTQLFYFVSAQLLKKAIMISSLRPGK